MIHPTPDVMQQFAEAVLYAHAPYGLVPSVENLMVWHERLKDLTLEQVRIALSDHLDEGPRKLPTPDGIRERIVGDERDPVEALRDEVVELRAVVAELQRQMGVAAEVAPVARVPRQKQKLKTVAAPAQLSLLPELENAPQPAA